MSNPFKIGDKVRFVDNELNRAEMCEITLSRIFEVELVNNKDKSIEIGFNGESHDSACDTVWHYSRFELMSQYQVGDWVEYTNGSINHQACVTGYTNHDFLLIQHLSGTVNKINPTLVIRKLSPSEVIVDFGNGIKGTISVGAVDADGHVLSFYVTSKKGWYCLIDMAMLTEPMRTIVTDLLNAQAKEESNE